MNVHRKLRKIMKKGRDEREIALRELAVRLGCSLTSTYGGDGSKHLEHEVLRRIHEAASSIRGGRLWWLAVISAIGSIISALAAWVAIAFSWEVN